MTTDADLVASFRTPRLCNQETKSPSPVLSHTIVVIVTYSCKNRRYHKKDIDTKQNIRDKHSSVYLPI
ncbi:hypothetical protein Cylst_1702 [Cylindrospermum stagnale PCC 7417]|uniref:Uncharacterized protein n=1 Tax=Cylindrospermum stagnale PCC 7417 TaxID=56107 RepID=K9WVY1_9NOST|nr:hypothetical protein Cylst_1702 [Cylindrospermum stagnale PCC 7417]